MTTHGVIFPAASRSPRERRSSRSPSVRPLATVGTGVPFTSTISRGASRIAWSPVTAARSGALPAATYSGSGLATQLWR